MKIYIKKHVRYIFYEESVKYTFQFIFYVRECDLLHLCEREAVKGTHAHSGWTK